MEGAGVFLQGPPAGWLRAALGRSNPGTLWPAGHGGGELCRAGRAVEPEEAPDKGVRCCQGTRRRTWGHRPAVAIRVSRGLDRPSLGRRRLSPEQGRGNRGAFAGAQRDQRSLQGVYQEELQLHTEGEGKRKPAQQTPSTHPWASPAAGTNGRPCASAAHLGGGGYPVWGTQVFYSWWHSSHIWRELTCVGSQPPTTSSPQCSQPLLPGPACSSNFSAQHSPAQHGR